MRNKIDSQGRDFGFLKEIERERERRFGRMKISALEHDEGRYIEAPSELSSSVKRLLSRE